MKQLLIFTGSVLFLCLIINHMVLPSLPATEAADPAPVQLTSYQQSSEITPSFRVTVYNGFVAVFREGEEKPFYITEARVSDLPPKDRQLLTEGIITQSRKEVDRLLLDYCS